MIHFTYLSSGLYFSEVLSPTQPSIKKLNKHIIAYMIIIFIQMFFSFLSKNNWIVRMIFNSVVPLSAAIIHYQKILLTM